MTETLRIIVEPAGLVIDAESYRTHPRHREIADAICARFGYDSADVVEARLTEGAVEVDVIVRDPFEIRTDRHDLR